MRSLAVSLLLALAGCSTPPGGFAGPDLAAPLDGAGGELGAGGCSPACTASAPACNASHHCVACLTDAQCPIGSQCKTLSDLAASCVPGCVTDGHCGPGKQCCGGRCVDPQTDSANCGACGTSCSASVLHASGTCKAGACAPGACETGYADCNQDPKDGCESNTHIDPANCGGCGTKCAIANAVNACADGCYVTACQHGWDDCNGDPMDGCETSVLKDPANCGACGQSCKNLPNASASCENAACTLGSCNAGFADCNGDAKDGCEANLNFDAKNCARCGVTCPINTPNCSNGKCGNAFLHWKEVEASACNAWCGGMMMNFPCANAWTCDMGHVGGFVWLYSQPMQAPPLTINVMAYGWASWYCGVNGCHGPGPAMPGCMGGGPNSVWQCVFE